VQVEKNPFIIDQFIILFHMSSCFLEGYVFMFYNRV